MDVKHPVQTIIPTLDAHVLEVLAKTTRSLTGGEIARLVSEGSVSGVRLALARLVRQGIVNAEQRAQAIFYTANRTHLAWPAVNILVNLRSELLNHIQHELQAWTIKPIHVSVFGSMARGDGDSESDIDLLVIRPDDVLEEQDSWASQIDSLRSQVRAWTGNPCQVFQLDTARLGEHYRIGDSIVENWIRDGVLIFGPKLTEILRKHPKGTNQ